MGEQLAEARKWWPGKSVPTVILVYLRGNLYSVLENELEKGGGGYPSM